MFYVGWVNGGINRFQNFLGMAIRNIKLDQNNQYIDKSENYMRSDPERNFYTHE